MHTIIIAEKFFPYGQETRRAREMALFCQAFKQASHEVSCVIPFPRGLDVTVYSLARRLMPIKVALFGKNLSFTRYDGRTAEGIIVHLLDFDGAKEEAAAAGTRAFYHAACAVAASFVAVPDAILTFGEEALLFPPICRAFNETLKGIPQIVTPRGTGESPGEVIEGLAHADLVVVSGNTARSAIVSTSEGGPSRERSASAVVAVPMPLTDTPSVVDKLSAKTALQLRFDLPVREDVPLVLVLEPDARAIADLVTFEVQVLAIGDPLRFSSLQSNYKDRLAIVATDEWRDLLASADACLVGGDRHRLTVSWALGALPMVDERLKHDVVDLEPSLETGSAIIVAGGNGPGLKEGMGRLVAAFDRGIAFKRLAARLPGLVPTWENVSSRYVSLIEEIKSEKNQHEPKQE